MNKNLIKIVGLAIIGIAFSSCVKNDFEEQNEVIFSQHKAEYETNFIKKYGEVDPNKSWDMSSHQPQYSLTSMYDAPTASTRSTDTYSRTKSSGFSVEKDVLTWFFTNTPAGQNNLRQGNPFSVQVTAAEFTIVPIFQGNAKKYWQLWMHVDGVANDIQIWEKGEDLSYRKGTNVVSVGKGQAGVAKDADEVVAPAITFSGMPAGNMHFYLKAWSTPEAYESDPQQTQYTKLTSLNRKMLSMDGCKKPNGVPSGTFYRIIGCEDAGDNDYEDLAFLIYGNFTIEEPRDVYEVIPKRYMVEDLGSTDDFDFNDVVIDLFNEYKTTYTYSISGNEETIADTDGPHLINQWAIVRAAGGTLDFTIKIGENTTWTKSQHVTPVTEMVNTGWDGAINYNGQIGEKFDIINKDWDSVHDNISIEVEGKDGYSGVHYIPFPKEGEIPMIIAVDTSVNWMHERNSVPDKWISNSPTQPNPGGSENSDNNN